MRESPSDVPEAEAPSSEELREEVRAWDQPAKALPAAGPAAERGDAPQRVVRYDLD